MAANDRRRDALAQHLWSEFSNASVQWTDLDDSRRNWWLRHADEVLGLVADSLLPVVREIAAEELRRAYIEDSTTVAKLSPVERLTCRIVKVEDLLPRIAALALTERMP